MTIETIDHSHELSRPAVALLVAVLLAGAALRIGWNDIVVYSPADETYYWQDARQIVDHGWKSYPELIARFERDPASWVFPNPMRWGAIGIDWAYCEAVESCEMRDLATVSTLAGIASLLLTFLLGRELLGTRTGLLAMAFSVSSPLQLAMGRRALTDETFCALALAFLWLYLRTVRGARRPGFNAAAAIAVGTLAMAVKELFIFLLPIALLMLLCYRWRRLRGRDVLVLVAPPLLHFSIFAWLAHSMGAFGRIAHIVASVAGAPYAAQYQSGPPQRPLLDLFILAPLVVALAIGATTAILARPRQRSCGERWLALAFVALLLTFGALPSKNVRYAIVADPLARLLAAAFVVEAVTTRPRHSAVVFACCLVVATAASELALFHRVFVVRGVYDPVTDALLRALDVLPR